MRFWIRVVFLTVTIFFLASTPALAEKHQRHQNGDIWVGCVADATATTWEQALIDAFLISAKENRPCWIAQQKGWWKFHHTARMAVITFRKIAKGPEASVLFSIHRSC